MEMRGRPSRRKNNNTLKACRDCLRELEEARDLIFHLQSHLTKIAGIADLRQNICEDPLVKACTPVSARAHQPHKEHVEDASPISLSPSASPAPLAEHSLLLASTMSLEPQRGTSDLKKIPLGTALDSSCQGSICAVPAISFLERTILILSWWWETAKVLFSLIWSQDNSQQERLFHNSPEALLWDDPQPRQMEAGGHSFINPDVQKLLEQLICKKAELKLWKEKEKEGSDYLLSLENMLNLLGQERATMTPQPFWNMATKPQQLPGSQQLSDPEALEEHLRQKCSQLFWGLPSLHSESLVATAWISRKAASKKSRAMTFNEVPSYIPVPTQEQEPSELSQEQCWPSPVAKLQPLTETQPQSHSPPLAGIQAESHSSCSVPNVPSSSLPKSRSCRTACPTYQEKAQSIIPTENQHLECPLQKRLKWKRVLPSLLENSQAGFSQPTPHLPRGTSHSQRPKSASNLPGVAIIPEHQGQLQQHIQRCFIKDEHRSGPPGSSQPPGEPMQPQDKFQRRCQSQVKDNKEVPLSSQSSKLADESTKDVQKMGSRHSGMFSGKPSLRLQPDQDPSQDQDQEMERIPEDSCRCPGVTSVKVLEEGKEESGSDFRRPQKYESGNDLPMDLEKKHWEKSLKVHVDSKLREFKQGTIPVSESQSWPTVNHAVPKRDTQKKTGNLASWRCQKPSVNTFQEISFLDPCTQQMLEEHLTSFQVRHKWNANLQSLEPISLHLGEAQLLTLPQSTSPSWATCKSGANSIAKAANFLREPLQKRPGGKVTTKKSVPIPNSPLSAPQLACVENQAVLLGKSSGDTHDSSEVPQTGQEGRWPSQSLPCCLVGRIWHSKILQGTGRASPELRLSSPVARKELWEGRKKVSPQKPCHSRAMPELSIGSQTVRVEDPMETVEAKEDKTAAKDVTLGTSFMADSLNMNVDLRGSGSLGTRKRPPFSRTAFIQDPGELCPKAQVISKFELPAKVKPEKEPPGCASGVLLKDCTTGLFLQGCCMDMLPATDILSSWDPFSGSQIVSSRNGTDSQGLCEHLRKGGSSQGQWKTGNHKVKAPWKSQNKILGPTDRKEGSGVPKAGDQENRSARPTISQVSGRSHLVPVREIGDTHGSKYVQLLPEKGQTPPESRWKSVGSHPQYLNPNKKWQGQEDSLPKGKHPSATAQNQILFMNSRSEEVWTIIKRVGEILLEKLGLVHGRRTLEINWQKGELQAQLYGSSHYHKGPSQPKQRRMSNTACSPQATPTKNRWIKDRDRNWTSLPRESVSPVGPSLHEPKVARTLDHLHCHPTYHLQSCVLSGKSDKVCHISSGREGFSQKKISPYGEKQFYHK